MKLSVVVCSRNRKKEFTRCVRKINKQTIKPYEFILIENITESKNFSEKWLNKNVSSPRCKYFKIRASNVAFSRNVWLREASGDIILSIDDDVEINDPLFFNKIIHLHKKYPNADAFVGRVGPLPRNIWSVYQSIYINYEMLLCTSLKKILFYPMPTISFKRKSLKELKIQFDTSYIFSDDVDFLIRFSEMHKNLYFHPSLKIYHNFTPTLLGFVKKNIAYGRGFPLLYSEHKKRFRLEKYVPRRKLYIILLPLYIVYMSLKESKLFINKFKLGIIYFIPGFIQELSFFIGFYTTDLGKRMLLDQLTRRT